jgi:hypothetical protein
MKYKEQQQPVDRMQQIVSNRSPAFGLLTLSSLSTICLTCCLKVFFTNSLLVSLVGVEIGPIAGLPQNLPADR